MKYVLFFRLLLTPLNLITGDNMPNKVIGGTKNNKIIRILGSLFIIMICIAPLCVSGQVIKFKINGVVQNLKDAKYAYLTTLSQQVTIASDKVFIKVPIVDGKFEFNGSFDLEGRDIQFANIFLDERGNITKEEVASKFKNLIWVSGRENFLFKAILENFSFFTKSREDIFASDVTKEGTINKDFIAYHTAIKAGRQQLISFIKSHITSPISLLALQSISFMGDASSKPGDSMTELFNNLSPKVKNSSDGKLMKEKLNIK